MSDLSPYSQPKPPITVTKVKNDSFLDITNLHTWIMFLAIVTGLHLFKMIAISPNIDKLMYLRVAFIIANIWYKFSSTDEKVQYNKDRVIFFVSETRGKHVINSFASSAEDLEKFIPIKKIHSEGIIEYSGSEYGIVIETYPNRISDEIREQHEMKLEKLVSGIPANTSFKTLSCSVLEPKKPVLNFLLDLSSKAGDFKPKNKHLTDMYLKISGDDSKVISWKYYAFLSLGKQKNLDQAKIQYGAVVPGLVKNMKAASLRPRILTENREILDSYRVMFTEMAL